MDRWELVGDGSAKFWEIGRDGSTVTVRYGRLDTSGQTKVKDLGIEATAIAHVAKLVAEKEKKGYKAVSAARSMQSTEDSSARATGPSVERFVPPPDETTFVMPRAWTQEIVPRRGGLVAVEPVEIQPNAGGFLRAKIDKLRSNIDTVLDYAQSDPVLVGAGRDYLAGTVTALGAAVLVEIVTAEESSVHWATHWRLADALVDLYGLVFAAEVVAELGHVQVTWTSAGTWKSPHRLVREMGGSHVTDRMRNILAAASQEQYDAVVEALAAHRNDDGTRLMVSYLVPTRVDWVDELCAVWASLKSSYLYMLCRSVGTAAQFEILAQHEELWFPLRDQLYTVIDGVGPACAPGMGLYLDQVPGTDERKKALRIIAALPTDEAFDVLLARVEEKFVRTTLLEVMKKYPVRAMRRLAAADSPGALNLLREHIQLHPDIVERADLPAETRAVVEEITARTEQVNEATDLPELLVTPPWLKNRTKAKPVVIEGLHPPAVDPDLVWEPGEQAEWAATDYPTYRFRESAPNWDQWIADYVPGKWNQEAETEFFLAGPVEDLRPLLDSWVPEAWQAAEWGRIVVARFQLDSLPPIRRVVDQNPSWYGGLLLPFAIAELAPLMAEWLVRLKAAGPMAEAWLARHAGLAAQVLVVQALAKPGKSRTYAETALRVVARHTDVRAVARDHGPEAEQAIAAVIDVDPLDILPATMPEPGDWANPVLLPRILLQDKETALPHSAVGHFLTMLALSTLDDVYPGVGVVVPLCDADSLADFAWALFERWLAVDSPPRDSWVLSSLGLFGDDETVRRLTPMIKAWPGNNGHAKAVIGLDVLAEIGTDVALMSLQNIAQKVPFKALKQRAREKIESVAEGLGLSGDQLGDRLVPTFGLDESASGTIDYGSRKFVVGFDEQLKPYITDEDGKRRKDLPKPAAKDDQELAPAEYKRFAQLKKDVRTVAGDQISRLEAAMVADRQWPMSEFTTLLVGHPLVWHIVRRLVWITSTGEAFRVAEDRTFADVNDDAYKLPDDALVSVAHPLDFDVEAWAEVFADYEILQPFPQLGRPTYTFTTDEAQATRLKRFEGVPIQVGKMLGLVKRGWQRGQPQDNGAEMWMLRPVPDGGAVVLNADPGITVGAVDMFPEQVLEHIWLSEHRRGASYPQGRRQFGELDPVTASEVLAELTELTS